MKSQNILWIDRLEQLIQQKHMLLHPFYQAWTQGMLTKATLQEYAKEYYQHVKAFPTYISALHSRCDDPQVRRSLLMNLMDEEAGYPNHPELWRSFALALGVDEEELDTHQPQTSTRELIQHFRESCNLQPISVGLAALYSYESQIPAICQTKIDGLRKWYGLTDPESYRYFSVHETVDIEHSHSEKQTLMALVHPEEEEAVLKGAENTLNALGNFLSSFDVRVCC
jgi:pyrroloquinoline-quinone synthase